MLGIGIGISLTGMRSGGAGFSPAALFANGEQGATWDVSDTSSLFQDVEGSIPVTASGQTVRRMLDRSGRGHHATQPNAALAPTYQTDGVLHWLEFGAEGKRHLIFDVSAYGSAPPLTMMGAAALTANGSFPSFLGSESTTLGVFFGLGGATDRRMRCTLGGGTGGTGPTIRGLAAFALNQAYVVSHLVREFVHSCWIDGTKQEEGPRTGTWGVPLEGHIGNGGATLTTYTRFYGATILRRELTRTEQNALGAFYAEKSGAGAYVPLDPPASSDVLRAYALGDSTIAPYSGQPSVISLIDTPKVKVNVAVPGNTINQQLTAWNALAVDPALVGWVVAQVGLNDLAPDEAASVAIARLQTLVDTVRTSIGPSNKLLIGQLLPCRQRLINLYGATNGPIAYAKWQAINEAIGGGGSAPIAGVDGRVTSHVAALNDGNDNLAAAYDLGDGIHENTAGRQIIADAWAAAVTASGVTP